MQVGNMEKSEEGQGQAGILEGNFVVNTVCKVMDSSLVIGTFGIDAEVVDIINRDVILGFSWLAENGFL